MRGQIIFPKIELLSDVKFDECKTNSLKVLFRAKTKEGEIFLMQAFDITAEKIRHMSLKKGIRVAVQGEMRQYVDQSNGGWIKDYVKVLNIDYADEKETVREIDVKNDLSKFNSKEVL